MLGACAAEINLLRKRRIGPYPCDFSANRTTMHLKIVKIWPRFSTFSLRSFLPRRLLGMIVAVSAWAVLWTAPESSAQETPLDCAKWNTEAYFETASDQDVKACLEAGADLNARDGHQNTPLHWAARKGNPAVIQMLMVAGADLNARGWQQETPLHSAARNYENPAVVVTLLAAGADPEARNYTKETPLHMAAGNWGLAMTQTLLAVGADPNARNGKQETPLHWAARNHESPAAKTVVKALLAAGADPNAGIGTI